MAAMTICAVEGSDGGGGAGRVLKRGGSVKRGGGGRREEREGIGGKGKAAESGRVGSSF